MFSKTNQKQKQKDYSCHHKNTCLICEDDSCIFWNNPESFEDIPDIADDDLDKQSN